LLHYNVASLYRRLDGQQAKILFVRAAKFIDSDDKQQSTHFEKSKILLK